MPRPGATLPRSSTMRSACRSPSRSRMGTGIAGDPLSGPLNTTVGRTPVVRSITLGIRDVRGEDRVRRTRPGPLAAGEQPAPRPRQPGEPGALDQVPGVVDGVTPAPAPEGQGDRQGDQALGLPDVRSRDRLGDPTGPWHRPAGGTARPARRGRRSRPPPAGSPGAGHAATSRSEPSAGLSRPVAASGRLASGARRAVAAGRAGPR